MTFPFASCLFAASLAMLPALAQSESTKALGRAAKAEQEVSTGKDATNVFPGLPLMPAGSVVKGIVLPRYEEGKVISLIKIATLTVESPSLVSVKDFTAALYDQAGNITKVVTPLGFFNFDSARVNSDGQITMDDPRFRARGQQLHFDTQKRAGVLRGPIRTIIPAAQNYSDR